MLGFAGVDNDGLDGLEKGLDRELVGKPGSQTIIRDPIGRAIDVVEVKPERPGEDVFLTIDHRLQANAENVLRRTIERWGALGGHAIVLEPQTGRVLAMAVAPGFDANNFGNVAPERRKNRAVTDVYEPGSTFKVVTVAAALSEKLVTPTTRFVLPYSIQVADRRIREHEWRPTKRMSVAQILSQSSNIGTITLAQKVTRTATGMSGWIERFGFGKPTGIDFPGESGGIVVPPGRAGRARRSATCRSARASASPACRWPRPTVRSRTAASSGSRISWSASAGSGRAIGLGQADHLPHGLGAADDDAARRRLGRRGHGRARGDSRATRSPARPAPLQSRCPAATRPRRYVASFVGVVPAKKPELVVLVSIDEPKGAIWGGVVAAPAFADIATFGLQYLEISPDAASKP